MLEASVHSVPELPVSFNVPLIGDISELFSGIEQLHSPDVSKTVDMNSTKQKIGRKLTHEKTVKERIEELWLDLVKVSD